VLFSFVIIVITQYVKVAFGNFDIAEYQDKEL